MKDSNQIGLGMQVRDRISGFEGIVVSLADHITGCHRIGVLPVERADRGDEEWFYPEQLEVVKEETEFSSIAENAETTVDFNLGDELKDEITGVMGYAGTVTFSLFNCPRVAIQPTDSTDSTEAPDREWFDVPRVKKTDTGISAEFEETVKSQITSETGASGSDVDRKTNRE